ncbi:MAG: hypothetical protein ACI9ZT_000007 [Gammaproteobacteria bacterium]
MILKLIYRYQKMNENLYIVANESGFGSEPLPVWTDRPSLINLFDASPPETTRVDIPEVPGAFQLLNVLSEQEADAILNIAEQLGFHEDSPVSLSHDVRHNENMNWVVSETIDGTIWKRSKHLVTEHHNEQTAKGLNARFRFYKYGKGDFFKLHTDGAWPGSRVKDGKLIANAYPGLYSLYSSLIFLNDGYEGGETRFMVSKSDPGKPASTEDDINSVDVSTPKGAILCFPHGNHPLQCLHAGNPISAGTKYIIRTEILFG